MQTTLLGFQGRSSKHLIVSESWQHSHPVARVGSPAGVAGLHLKKVARLCCRIHRDTAVFTFSKPVFPRSAVRVNACPWQRTCPQHLSPCPEGRSDRTVTLIIYSVQAVIKIQALGSLAGKNTYKPIRGWRARRRDMAHERHSSSGAMLHAIKRGM